MCFLSVDSELEQGHTALDTYSASPGEKIEHYQAGQTVTCFLKKVTGTLRLELVLSIGKG